MDGENIRLVWRLAAGLLLATAGDGIGAVDFEAQVRPVFAEHCYGCHGEEKRKGDLRLDTVEGIRRGGNSGEPLFVAGDAERSHLFKLVSGVDPEERMPPEGKGLLGGDELGLIGQWIDEGAVLPGGDLEVELTTDHWSFQPVVRGQVPAGGGGWGVGAVDAFVGRALSERGLTASVRAGRRMLVRRLYLVMHGLPPTREEAEEFVADVEPGAWGRLVDRVLASPRFGERWARHWLDVVRFAETNGFETNRERLTAYRFRDYIIESFNADKPYDQLVREHLAGDATGADVGTGFLVAGAYDIVKSPDVNLTLMQRQDELADMVNTTGTAFLGLTLGCARCHNHKFDPILQKDFYAMQAVFAGVRHGERAIAEDGSAVDGSAVDGKRPAVSARGNTEEFPVTGAKYVRLTISRTNSGGEP
ncbi:MAG: DUF1549 domain-containing protein, partial [Verrucomicrobiales bacterium]|nr:DUF1549 domain-containing protein [Verrucomicrobiales bacterium]